VSGLRLARRGSGLCRLAMGPEHFQHCVETGAGLGDGLGQIAADLAIADPFDAVAILRKGAGGRLRCAAPSGR